MGRCLRLPLVAGILVALLALVTFFGFERQAIAKGKTTAAPLRLEIPGAEEAFYYRPRLRGQRPVLMVLHGRGANPEEECRKWAKVGTQFGWVVCPQGPVQAGGGARTWANDASSARLVVDGALKALRAKFGRKVQLRENILIGFSEGAFIGMQLGVADPGTWSRWLILAANDQYWVGDSVAMLREHRRHLRRVYLLTGESDLVAPNTVRVGNLVREAKIPVKVKIAPGMGHEVPADRMITTYRRPLLWLASR